MPFRDGSEDGLASALSDRASAHPSALDPEETLAVPILPH